VAIDIVRYDPAWPEQFRAGACKLTELLGPWLATPVEHIGSTSLPGLAAKPILDMMAGVHDLHSARDAIPALTSRYAGQAIATLVVAAAGARRLIIVCISMTG
jgi:GrpB-like predicted nucleotidyltransferase (UPF0157 family)